MLIKHNYRVPSYQIRSLNSPALFEHIKRDQEMLLGLEICKHYPYEVATETHPEGFVSTELRNEVFVCRRKELFDLFSKVASMVTPDRWVEFNDVIKEFADA